MDGGKPAERKRGEFLMADYLTTDTELTSIANAIRTKGGTAAQLTYPAGFVSAINDISSGSIQRIILRPDAELWKTWTYDGLIVADEGVTIPAYATTQQALKTSVRLEEITLDDSNYKYAVIAKTLSIPIYNTIEIAKGRFEWGATTHIFEDVVVSGGKFKTLVDGSSASASSMGFSGGNYYRGVNFGVYVTPVIQTNNTYGTWQSFSSPSFGSGKLRINSPSFVMRGNDNTFSKQFWEATTDIRYQYVIELWRAPIGSLSYDGWQWAQSFDQILDRVYSNDHSLSANSINDFVFTEAGVAMRDWHISGTFDGQIASFSFTCTLDGEDLYADTEYQMLYLDGNSSLYELVDASATRFYAEDPDFDVWFDANGLSLMPHADVYDGTTISIAVSCLPEPGEQMD